jgi:hypothetical protein
MRMLIGSGQGQPLGRKEVSAIPGPGLLCARLWGQLVQNHGKPVCCMGKKWQILDPSRLRKAVTWGNTIHTLCTKEINKPCTSKSCQQPIK